MGATTGVEWAHSTVNIWEGCTKASPACRGCYAETDSAVRVMQKRVGLKMWGVNGFRYETANWERELRSLNRKAKAFREGYLAGGGAHYERPRVFINSLSDTFEDWSGPVYRLKGGKPVVVAQSLDDVRARFFRVAEECTELDLLLVTKRPENVIGMVPAPWLDKPREEVDIVAPSGQVSYRRHRNHADIDEARNAKGYTIRGLGWPSHIWLGTTVEDQEHADKRIPELLKVPAKVRFLSVEPLLGKVDLDSVCLTVRNSDTYSALQGYRTSYQSKGLPGECSVGVMSSKYERIHWVIAGCESGTSARPMHPDWVRSIRDQCVSAGVPFFFKQAMGDNGKVQSLPELDGKRWSEVPK